MSKKLHIVQLNDTDSRLVDPENGTWEDTPVTTTINDVASWRFEVGGSLSIREDNGKITIVDPKAFESVTITPVTE